MEGNIAKKWYKYKGGMVWEIWMFAHKTDKKGEIGYRKQFQKVLQKINFEKYSGRGRGESVWKSNAPFV